MAAFEAWLVLLILVANVVGELQRKRTIAASRGFLAAARLSCLQESLAFTWVSRRLILVVSVQLGLNTCDFYYGFLPRVLVTKNHNFKL